MTGDSIHIPQSVKFLTSLLEQNRSNLNQLQEHQPILIQVLIFLKILY